jgi:hypothetical protein
MERELRKGSTTLTYIPVSEVITRMNKVVGVDKWSSTVIRVERDAIDPDFIVAHVRVTVEFMDSTVVTKDGFGGQKIKRTKSGDIVDLGDEYKGAVSDAFKKACQMLGVGLYLARSEDALDIDETTQEQQAPVDPNIQLLWTNMTGLTASLTSTEKKALGEFWNEYSGGRPKPTLATANVQDLEALIAECSRLSLGGEFVEEQGD